MIRQWIARILSLGTVGPLADATRWRSMGGGFRGRRARVETSDLLTGLAIVVAVAVGVFLLYQLLARQERQRRHNNPKGLFRSLCRAHGLDRASCRLLRRVARFQRLRHPARLFVEADRYEPDELSPALRDQLADLEKIRAQLFRSEQ